MAELFARRAVVVGLGLIGGSFAAALKGLGLAAHVVGVDTDSAAGASAVEQGLVHSFQTAWQDAVRDADLIVLATPVRHILHVVENLGVHVAAGTLVVDVGSTKQAIVEALDRLPPGVNGVGGHPMTGKRSAGVEGPNARIFQGKPFLLTPSQHTSKDALDRALRLVSALGARPKVMDPAHHDRLAAIVSHVPRLLPVALIAAANRHGQEAWEVAAGGFRDAISPAKNAPSMWQDIFLTNPEGIAEALDALRDELQTLRELIVQGDEEGLWKALTDAQAAAEKALGK